MASLIAGLERSEAQRLATDQAPARPGLAQTARQLADAERERTDAVAAQRRLERSRPGWYRPTARRLHAEELAGLHESAREAASRVEKLRERQTELLTPERRVQVRVERLRPLGRAIEREFWHGRGAPAQAVRRRRALADQHEDGAACDTRRAAGASHLREHAAFRIRPADVDAWISGDGARAAARASARPDAAAGGRLHGGPAGADAGDGPLSLTGASFRPGAL